MPCAGREGCADRRPLSVGNPTLTRPPGCMPRRMPRTHRHRNIRAAPLRASSTPSSWRPDRRERSVLRISVLDQSTIVTGRSADASIRESIRLAAHCESLGYARYWCAEHHNSDSQAGTAPEILISAIAATTQRIRVGSAGVMLPHYAALKVAEQFRVLDAIAPGRIDLGLGRAPESDGLTGHALNPRADSAADEFPAEVRDLMCWLSGEKLMEG